MVIELVEGEHPDARYWRAAAPAVAVPPELDDSHPVARRLREKPDLLDVSDESRARALLIVQALVSEAERRGHVASVHAGGPGFWIEIGEHAYQVTIRERWAEVDELPKEEDLARQKTYPWQRVQARRVPDG